MAKKNTAADTAATATRGLSFLGNHSSVSDFNSTTQAIGITGIARCGCCGIYPVSYFCSTA